MNEGQGLFCVRCGTSDPPVSTCQMLEGHSFDPRMTQNPIEFTKEISMKHLSLLAVLVLMDLSGSAEAGQYTFYAGCSHGAVVVRRVVTVRSAAQLSAAVDRCLAVPSALASPCKSSCAPSPVCVSSCGACGVGVWLQRMFRQCCQCRRCRG